MKPTQEQVIAWAREAGFDEYETTSLSGNSELDRTLQVNEYPVGESVFALVALAYEAGRKDENEACAAQVGQQWVAFEELKAAHYRHSPEPFDPFRFHRDLSTIFFSRDMADAIRARREQ